MAFLLAFLSHRRALVVEKLREHASVSLLIGLSFRPSYQSYLGERG